jgi:hypothetical protein
VVSHTIQSLERWRPRRRPLASLKTHGSEFEKVGKVKDEEDEGPGHNDEASNAAHAAALQEDHADHEDAEEDIEDSIRSMVS